MSSLRKKVILFIGFLCLTTLQLSAQTGNEIDKNSTLKERIFTGGNFGLSFGNITYIEIAPLLGYRFTNNLSAGGGFAYRYRKDKRFTPEISTSDYGINLFARYNVYNPFYAQVEYEFLNYEFVVFGAENRRESYSSLLAGGGVSQPMGRNAALNFSVLYNLSYSELTPGPYDSPWIIRGGLSVGF